MPVEELPAQWNRRMRELLGIEPATDAQGCLQDIHWAEGLFGYFPSYALGHLISAQITEAMEERLGPVETRIATGEESGLRDWLQTYLWPLGRSVNAEELVERVSGAPLSASPFLRYLTQKLDGLGLAIQPLRP